MPRILLPATAILVLANGVASLPARAGEPHATPIPVPVESQHERCVDVQVNGERVPDYGCLGRLMKTPPASAPPMVPLGSERIARRPPTELGLANRAATQQRMGNTFGTSTRPQRPPPPPPSPVIPGR